MPTLTVTSERSYRVHFAFGQTGEVIVSAPDFRDASGEPITASGPDVLTAYVELRRLVSRLQDESLDRGQMGR